MTFSKIALGCVVFAALSSPALAEGVVIGDSLGVGVNFAARVHSLAKNSVRIQGGTILEQIRQMKAGATVFMSLGTNDAVGGAVDIRKAVQNIVAAAAAQDIKLVWIGPPCVIKPWNSYSKQIDASLQTQLRGTSVTFVSMQGSDLCSPSVHAKDGVHFTMAGYSNMWQKAASAVGFPIAAAASTEHKVAAKKSKKKKHARKKPARKKLSAPKTAAPRPEVIPGAT